MNKKTDPNYKSSSMPLAQRERIKTLQDMYNGGDLPNELQGRKPTEASVYCASRGEQRRRADIREGDVE
jgi:hypothetical protein